VKIYPAHFFAIMWSFFKHLIAVCVFLPLGVSIVASPPGFLEGHLKIFSLKEVELADQAPSKMAATNYSDYPLVILSQNEKREIARITADADGNYRITLPPGDYILDAEGRSHAHVRAKPQPFTIVSNQTKRVDMDIDTGIR
jgi:hypothetical protein